MKLGDGNCNACQSRWKRPRLGEAGAKGRFVDVPAGRAGGGRGLEGLAALGARQGSSPPRAMARVEDWMIPGSARLLLLPVAQRILHDGGSSLWGRCPGLPSNNSARALSGGSPRHFAGCRPVASSTADPHSGRSRRPSPKPPEDNFGQSCNPVPHVQNACWRGESDVRLCHSDTGRSDSSTHELSNQQVGNSE